MGRLLDGRDALARQPLSGLGYVRALSDATDVALRELWADESSALVAIGGYGRGELSPKSDIDLAVVYKGRSKPEKKVKELLYPLWDAGLEVGHGTRTVKDTVRLAAEDIEAHAAFLDARLIAGDAGLFRDMQESVDAFTRKRGITFAKELQETTRRRHAGAGDVPFLLEPNVKDGAGGLRDLHVARWLARFFDLPALDPGSAEILHRIRNWLHHAQNRRADVVLLSLQDEAGRDLGYGGDRAGDALMRDLYATARIIWWHAQSCIAGAVNGGLRGPDVSVFAEGSWSADARRSFLQTLREGSAHALEALDQEGVVARMLPGWEDVRCLPQRNIYHRYTVDVHCFEAVANLAALSSDSGMGGSVWRDVADHDRALLAALFHDAGKGSGEDHSVRGERLASEWVRAMGLGVEAAADVSWLVRNHLLLAETATRRDTEDERLVESFAAQAGHAERLRMLYVLTIADAQATGPEAWTPWKAALVSDLFVKALRVLERGEVVGQAQDQVIKRRTVDVRRLLEREPGEIDAHLLGMTRSYLLAFDATALVRHFSLMNPPPVSDEVRMSAVPAGEPGVYEIVFAARDRPGLFSLMSGALAAGGINIVAAQAFTRADGVALEAFRGVGAFEPSFDETRWARLQSAALAALRGEIDLAAELAQRRQTYAYEYKGKREPTTVVVDNEASDFATVIEVHATDRIGLLYEITRAMAEMGLDIQVARIATYGHDVVDAFYVRDLEGQRITNPDRVAALRTDIPAMLDASGALE